MYMIAYITVVLYISEYVKESGLYSKYVYIYMYIYLLISL